MAYTAQRQSSRTITPPLEKNIVKSILKWLNEQPGCYACKVHGGPYMSGWPDIIGCCQGMALALEVKRPGGRATKLQLAVLRKWQEAGAISGVVTSVEDVKELVSLIKGG